MAQIQVMTPGQARTRINRRPSFPIAGGMVPFGLYPIFAHPVLPGETLENATVKFQARSAPIVNPLAGCWLEMWLVYVKLTDLSRDLGEMFISDTYSSAGWTAGSDNARTFVKSGQIDWVGKCLSRVHEAYFMDENETARTIDGVPQVKMSNQSWYQNMIFKPADEAVGTTDVFDTAEQLRGWQMLQQMQMDEITYEAYLRQYGVQSINAALGDPEILRYARSWTLPRNEIDATDGSPASAWLWSDDIMLDKPKRFDEPGFVICMGSVRPKMYEAGLQASFIGNLWGFTDWFPAYNLDDPTASVREIAANDTVFAPATYDLNGADSLLYDHRDLLSHGEQFLNGLDRFRVPVTAAMDTSSGANDAASVRGEYAALADIQDLFTAEATAADYCVQYDGMGALRIAGHIRDTTR